MPTSPVTAPASPSEIEAVFGDVADAQARTAPAETLVGEWKRFAAFLRRPNLDIAEQNGAPLTVLARIFALDLLAIFVLIGLASLAVAMGVYLPKTGLAGMEFTATLVLAVIIGAPVFEELAFRSWLSGRPGHVIAVLAIATGAAGFGIAHMSAPIAGMALFAIGLIAALAALIGLRKRPPMPWFAKLFPGFFWFATLSFALVHLANFDEGSVAILLPLVLPQFVLGMMLGYVRVRLGLWAAILLHAAHNATAVSLAALSTLAA